MGKNKVHIIGQGLAGTVLALQLLERGIDIHIRDKGLKFGSSKLAAGLWNPVGFKNLHAIWNARLLLDEMHRFYLRAEAILGTRFFYPKPLLRIFSDTLSINEWDERSVRDDLRNLIGSDLQFGHLSNVNNPHGYGIVASAGWLDVTHFLESARAYFLQQGLLIEQEATDWDRNQATVWCTGIACLQHPLWKNVRIIPNKGELLTVEMDLQGPDVIYNFGRFLFQRNDGSWKYGATYSFNDFTPAPTAAVRTELENDLKQFVHCDFQVADHQYGFRPTTPDRRPLIGAHPELPGHFIFNGLGSRGVMLAPWCAAQIVSFFQDDQPIPSEISLARFKSNQTN